MLIIYLAVFRLGIYVSWIFRRSYDILAVYLQYAAVWFLLHSELCVIILARQCIILLHTWNSFWCNLIVTFDL